MRTVSSAPSTIVVLTPLSALLDGRTSALTICTSTSDGSRSLSSATASLDAAADLDHVGVLHLEDLDRDRRAGR